ncbi:MAG: acylphosphatase [Gammaproteobacteria bacterium]|nr:acylphosphatase [Gammaproteobacteria bacterium]
MPCRHYRVYGRVQGVFYRASAQEQAEQLGLTGWVRNLPDGCVEAVACGSEQQLTSFENWLQQGSAMARVENLDIEAVTDPVYFNKFEVRYS